MHLYFCRYAPMVRPVKARKSTGQMGVNPEPLNLEPLNGYIAGTRGRVNRSRPIFFYEKVEGMLMMMNKPQCCNNGVKRF